jgi:hypothetical protein
MSCSFVTKNVKKCEKREIAKRGFTGMDLPVKSGPKRRLFTSKSSPLKYVGRTAGNLPCSFGDVDSFCGCIGLEALRLESERWGAKLVYEGWGAKDEALS